MSFRHLHIVACAPRSGTTLLHEAMVTCMHVDRHHEHELRYHLGRAAPGELLLTKRPKDTPSMAAVLAAVPDFHVVYLLRDPRDVIVSRHGRSRDRYYTNIRVWRENQAAAADFVDHPRCLVLRYEDFVADPDAAQRQLCARFPWLRIRHPFSRYHEHAQVSAASLQALHSVRPIAPDSVGLWRDNLPRVKAQQLLHGSLSPDLVAAGYEPDDRWEGCLADVVPDPAPSRYPESVGPLRRTLLRLDARRKLWLYLRARRAAAGAQAAAPR